MKLKYLALAFIAIWFNDSLAYSQGRAHQFLFGCFNQPDTFTSTLRGKMIFDISGLNIIQDNFGMPFTETQANISDENGDLLFASNGIYIMNSTGGMMLNGGGLNPGAGASQAQALGMYIQFGNIVLPFPGDSNKYILLHHTSDVGPNYSSNSLFMTIIDMTLDNGNGAIISKNVVVNSDSCDWGIAACQHANGRDWWITIPKAKSDTLITLLCTPAGIFETSRQSFGFPTTLGNVGCPMYSREGTKFSITSAKPYGSAYKHDVRLYDFDRCSGVFSNAKFDSIDNQVGSGAIFSPNGKFIYTISTNDIYQYQTDTLDFIGSKKKVATYDGFMSLSQTVFWSAFLAANGKIYISSHGPVIDLTCIEYPNISDTMCFVNQHSVHLPAWCYRGSVNHPNYYLGRLQGSPCDTLSWVGVEENTLHDFKIGLSPNPSIGSFKIIYLLPSNESGELLIYNLMGQIIYRQTLPEWTTLQNIQLPNVPSGIYQCTIKCKSGSATKKLMVVGE
jgi:Secretion system C-terminal sorting domain